MSLPKKSIENVLEKKGIRKDSFWTNPYIYRSKWLRRIPFALDTKALLASQYAPYEDIRALQTRRFESLLRHASQIPFWGDILRRSHRGTMPPLGLDAVASLPVISKKDFVAHEPGFFTDKSLAPESFSDSTSGSTGQPFRFLHDRSYELRSFAICERFFRTVGRGERYPIVSMRARERMGFAFSGYRFFYTRDQTSVRHRLDELLRVLRSFHGNAILFGFTSSIVELANEIAARRIALPARAIIAAGENISETVRKQIEQQTGVEVWTHYAMGELGRLAFECERHVLHINEEWAYLEIVDGAGMPVPHGTEGRVVATVFDNPAMPFIRYDTGDRGVIRNDGCPCGRTLRTLSLKGRDLRFIAFPDGREASLLQITAVFDNWPNTVRQYQIVRTGDYTFRARVVPAVLFETHRGTLGDLITRRIHPNAKFTWEQVDSIESGPSGKAVYYVDETA